MSEIVIVSGVDVPAAPGVELSAGTTTFAYRDHAGIGVAGVNVRMQVLSGGGRLGGAVGIDVLETMTGGGGVFQSPTFALGSDEGPNIVLVQTDDAAVRWRVVGTWSGSVLRFAQPVPADRDFVSGRRRDVVLEVRDLSGRPIPRLALELEVTEGHGLFSVGFGAHGPYDIRRSGVDGNVALQLHTGRHEEAIVLRARAYQNARIADERLVLSARAPTLYLYSRSSQPATPLGSLPLPIRPEVVDSTSGTFVPSDEDIEGPLVLAREQTADVLDLHPPSTTSVDRFSAIYMWPKRAEDFEVELRMPDYVDTPKQTTRGEAIEPLRGSVPRTSGAGSTSSGFGIYIRSTGGGNEDLGHFLRADIIQGVLQTLGPNATAPSPVRVRVQVLPQSGTLRLIEARFKFKLRITPYNSNIDDPSMGRPDLSAGAIATTPAGAGADEVTQVVPGSVGSHTLDVYFRSDEQNHNVLIDVTAEVTMEDDDPGGPGRIRFDRDTTLLLRAGVMRPRMALTRFDGSGHVPIAEEGVRPVTLMEAGGTQVRPNATQAFFVEFRSHDVGSSIDCHLASGSNEVVTLQRVAQNDVYNLYRSPPCFAYIDEKVRGGPSIAAAQAEVYVEAGRTGYVRAWIDREMPGNTRTPLVKYVTPYRPLTRMHLCTAGDGAITDSLPPPTLLVALGANETWPHRIFGGRILARLDITVYDAAADLGAPRPTEIAVNGTPQPLTAGPSAVGFGRPAAWVGQASPELEVPFGTSTVEVVVDNALGMRARAMFEVHVTERTNNRSAPADVTVGVRRIGRSKPRQPPTLRYIFVSTTDLSAGPGALPASISASLQVIEPDPGGAVLQNYPQSLQRRSTRSGHYASAPFAVVREDLWPTGTAPVLPLLSTPPGCRLGWISQGVPNELGSLFLHSFVEIQSEWLELQRQVGPTQWERARRAVPGDRLRVIGHSAPARVPELTARIAFRDQAGEALPGPERGAYVRLARTSGTQYVLDAYFDASFNPVPASTIAVAEDHDSVSGMLPLRLLGGGRIHAAMVLGDGWPDVDIPAFIPPLRARVGSIAMPQEGPTKAVKRLGFADSVVPGTGELVLHAFDRGLPARGLPVSLSRVFRSGNRFVGPLGPFWHPSWHVRGYPRSRTEIDVLFPDGQLFAFEQTASGDWAPPPGCYVSLRRVGAGIELRLAGGTSMVLGPQSEAGGGPWLLLAVADRFGNCIRYAYGDHGRIAHAMDTHRRDLSFTWNANRTRVLSVGDFTSATVEYRYFPPGSGAREGVLASVQGPAAVRDPSVAAPSRAKVTYSYHGSYAGPGLASVQDPEGDRRGLPPLLKVQYDGDGRVEKQSDERGEFTFKLAGTPPKYADRRGIEHQLEFAPSPPGGFAPMPSAVRKTVSGTVRAYGFQYNAERELAKSTLPLGNAVETIYNDGAADPRARGQLRTWRRLPDATRPRIVTRRGTSTIPEPQNLSVDAFERGWTYDADQLLQTVTDELGRTTTFTNTAGAVTNVARPDAFGATLDTSIEVNRWGQPIQEISPHGVVTRYHYFPDSDPTGGGGGAPVSAETKPGGLLAMVERDVGGSNATRSPQLAPLRTVREKYTYDVYGFASTVRDGAQQTIRLRHNALGDLLEITGALGERTQRAYDLLGRVTEIRHKVFDIGFPPGVAPSTSVDLVDTYAYDREGSVTEAVVDATQMKITNRWSYDANGNVEYDYLPRSNRAVQPMTYARIHYAYDEGNQPTKVTNGEGSTTPIVLNRSYDANGLLRREWYNTGRGHTYLRDAYDRIALVQDETGAVANWQRDDAGNLVRTQIRGSVDGATPQPQLLLDETRFLSAQDRLVVMRKLDLRYPLDAAAPRGRVGTSLTYYNYDEGGAITYHRDPARLATRRVVDAHGKPAKVHQLPGMSAKMEYDGAHRLTRMVSVDQLGQITTEWVYDGSGRLIEEKSNGKTVRKVWYDSLGQARLVEDATGNRVENVYDRGGRLVEVRHELYLGGVRVNHDGTTNPGTGWISASFDYDEDGKLVSAKNFTQDVIESYEYYANGNVHKRTMPDDRFTTVPVRDPNPGPEVHEYTYWDDGLLRTHKGPGGSETTHNYDLAGRLSSRRTVNSAVALVGSRDANFRWDGMGRLVHAADDNGGTWVSVDRRYSSLGQLTEDRQTVDFGGSPTSSSARGDYDQTQRLTTLHYPGQARIVHTPHNILAQVTRVRDNSSGDVFADYAYHGPWFSHRTYPNGVNWGLGYDGDKAVLEVRTYTGGDFSNTANMVEGHRYAYDKGGRIRIDKDLVEDTLERIHYDSLGRVDEVTDGYDASTTNPQPENGQFFKLDLAGNPTTARAGEITGVAPSGGWNVDLGAETTTTYNAANQFNERVTRTIATGQTQTLRGRWDEQGNLMEDLGHVFFFDAQGRLAESAKRQAGALHKKHFYDVFGRRVAEQRAGQSSIATFAWFGDLLLQRKAEDGVTWQRFIYGGPEDDLVAYETNRGGTQRTYYVHADRSGNVEFLTDAAGAVVEKYRRDAFGGVAVVDEDDDAVDPADRSMNPFMLHRHYFDEDTGLYMVGPRCFHPGLGRFIQRDPGGALYDPAARGNPYLYAGGDGFNATDDGRAALPAWAVYALGYVIVTAVIAVLATAIEYGIHLASGSKSEFEGWNVLARHTVVGLLTNWIPFAVAVRPAASLGRVATAVIIRWAASTAIEYAAERSPLRHYFGFPGERSLMGVAVGNAGGGLLGGIGSAVVGKVFGRIFPVRIPAVIVSGEAQAAGRVVAVLGAEAPDDIANRLSRLLDDPITLNARDTVLGINMARKGLQGFDATPATTFRLWRTIDDSFMNATRNSLRASFDMVFSNRFATNYLGDWPLFARYVAHILRPGGRVEIRFQGNQLTDAVREGFVAAGFRLVPYGIASIDETILRAVLR